MHQYPYAAPRHEASLVSLRGRSRWVCRCGAQMKGWSEDPQAVMRSYAEHNGLVEKRK